MHHSISTNQDEKYQAVATSECSFNRHVHTTELRVKSPRRSSSVTSSAMGVSCSCKRASSACGVQADLLRPLQRHSGYGFQNKREHKLCAIQQAICRLELDECLKHRILCTCYHTSDGTHIHRLQKHMMIGRWLEQSCYLTSGPPLELQSA